LSLECLIERSQFLSASFVLVKDAILMDSGLCDTNHSGSSGFRRIDPVNFEEEADLVSLVVTASESLGERLSIVSVPTRFSSSLFNWNLFFHLCFSQILPLAAGLARPNSLLRSRS
jgi:hypothetical protein